METCEQGECRCKTVGDVVDVIGEVVIEVQVGNGVMYEVDVAGESVL